MTEWFTVAEIEKKTRIPDATIRRYIRNHGHHLNFKKKGKSYYIADESIQVIEKIRELYNQGKTIEEMEDSLAKSNIPLTVTVMTDDEQVTVNTAETLVALEKGMTEQRLFNERLIEVIKKQGDKIDSLEKAFHEQKEYNQNRDKEFLNSLKQSLETRKEVATTKLKKWYQFWK